MSLIPVEEALRRVLDSAGMPVEAVREPLVACAGRVLAEDRRLLSPKPLANLNGAKFTLFVG